QLQAPIEYPAKALRLTSPIDREALKLCRVGLSREGGHGKQRNDASDCSPESAVGVVEGQGIGMEPGKKLAARLGSDQLVGYKYNAKYRSHQDRGECACGRHSFAQNPEHDCWSDWQCEVEGDGLQILVQPIRGLVDRIGRHDAEQRRR